MTARSMAPLSNRARTGSICWAALSVALVMAVLVAAGCSSTPNAAASSTAGLATTDAAEAERDSAPDEPVPDVPVETVPVRPEVVIPQAWPSDIEELYGRYWLYWEAFAAAHAPPNADPSFEELRLLSTDENWQSLQTQLTGFARDGLVLVIPPNSITEHLIRVPNPSVLEKSEGAEVMIQDCWIDDFLQQTTDGTVVAETREAKLMNASLKVVDGEWRVDGVSRATSESDGYEQCVALIS